MPTAQSKHGGAMVRFPPPLVFLGFLLLGLLIHFAVSRWPVRLPAVERALAAIILCGSGLALGIGARGLFVRTGQDPAPWKPTPEVLMHGPYRFTRNPMYVGMTLLTAGIGVAAGDLWLVAFALPALVVVHFIAVKPEEAHLSEKFGEVYDKYKASVRRYF